MYKCIHSFESEDLSSKYNYKNSGAEFLIIRKFRKRITATAVFRVTILMAAFGIFNKLFEETWKTNEESSMTKIVQYKIM